jgi:single-strand DNA-binding protein
MPATAVSTPPRDVAHRNEVLLSGTLQAPAQARELTDGREVMTFRLLVARGPELAGADSIECTTATAATRRAASGWDAGDEVEVGGALRRRFYRVGTASRPFTVVEVTRARRLVTVTRRRKRG